MRALLQMMIVEDEDILRRWIATGVDFSAAGYAVAGTARNGLEALSLIEKTPVDVVLTDIKMPDMDGIELMRILRQNRPDMEVVVLSGYNSFDHAREAIRYGAFEFLTKPLDQQELMSSLVRLRERLAMKRKEERTSYWATLQSDTSLLDEAVRDAFFTSLLTKRMDASFIANSLEQMGFTPGCRKFVALAAFALGGDDEPEDTGELLRFFIARLASYLKNCSVAQIQGLAVILAPGETAKDVSEWLEVARTAVRSELRRQYPHAAVTVALAGPATDDRISDVYGDALALYEHCFFEGYDELVELWRLRCPLKSGEDTDGAAGARLLGLTHAVVEAVVDQDKEGYSAAAARLIGAFANEPSVNAASARLRILELLMMADARLAGRGFRLKVFEEKHLMYSIISQRRTLVSLAHLLDTYAERAMQEVREQTGRRAGEESVSRRVMDHIAAHIEHKLTLEDIAREVFLSPTYLSSLFKKETGMTLTQCVTTMKLRRAQEMLSSPGARTQEVADMLGFSDYRYFCTIFKKTVGVPPQQYKNMLHPKR